MGALEPTPRAPHVLFEPSLPPLTAKIGAGFRQYPRANGVLVPGALRALVDASSAATTSESLAMLSQRERLTRGRAVVEQVSHAFRRLPVDILAMPLPPPRTVVRACPIEHRTRNVVERLIFTPGDQPWTVARYLAVPKLGPRCLVDLLAAHEEACAAPQAAAKTLPGSWLHEVGATLGAHLPVTSSDLPVLFPHLFANARVSLDELGRTFARAGMSAPFRVIRRGAVELAVPPAGSGIARALCENAARQVASWGMTEVETVVGRAHAVGMSSAGETTARRLLVALPRLRWLDERRTWFSFVGELSPLGKAVQRVFTVAAAVDLDELVAGLAKSHPAVARSPRAVVLRYLTEIAGCRLSGAEFQSRGGSLAVPLPADEAALVTQLLQAGGQADAKTLRRGHGAHTTARATFERLVARSPLFVETSDGTLRLVGRRPGTSTESPRAAEASLM